LHPDVASATGAEGFALPAHFWAGFRRTHWEAKGTVLRQPFATPIASPGEVFRCLVKAGERYRPRSHDADVEFCLEGAALLADVGKHLPRAGDRTAAAYGRRVTGLLEGQRFGLVVSELQQYGAPLWFRLRDFVRGLVAAVGTPATAKATLFLGNYRNTPFGVHRGQSSNFMFVIEGRKRILGWPDAYMRRHKADPTYTLDYRRYRKDAVVLEGTPGDILYFPSDYWHIGEDVGGLSMAVSLMLFMEARPAEHVLPHVEERLATRLGAGTSRPGRSARRGTLRPVPGVSSYVESALTALRAMGRDTALRRMLTAAGLNHATGSGFTAVPPPLVARTLAETAVVRGHPEYPIRWLSGGTGEILCSANGHAFTIAAHPKIPALIERLNGGEPYRVGDLVREYAGAAGKGSGRALPRIEVRTLLSKLASLRALTTQPS
jgi:50S ribosomal protein L16 3-hydroxylase